jgi:hypothetical protein
MSAILIALLSVGALRATSAASGLVISSDSSDLCTANLKTCRTRCAPPQTYVFECSSGGTFSRPKSECKCITPPPAGVVTDGSESLRNGLPCCTTEQQCMSRHLEPASDAEIRFVLGKLQLCVAFAVLYLTIALPSCTDY